MVHLSDGSYFDVMKVKLRDHALKFVFHALLYVFVAAMVSFRYGILHFEYSATQTNDDGIIISS
jgi:hypothetical protein